MFKKILIFALRRPMMSLAALLMMGGGVTALLSMSGGGAQTEGGVPVIQAESRPFKIVPDEPGGMQVAGADTTVFNTLRSPNNFSVVSGGKVENLLDPDLGAANDAAAEKLAAFSESVEDIMDKQPATSITAELNTKPKMQQGIDITESAKLAKIETQAGDKNAGDAAQLAQAAKVDERSVNVSGDQSAPVKLAAVPKQKPSAPVQMNAAGSSPETLAFVRAVLNKQQEVSARQNNGEAANVVASASNSAEALAAIAPAAGGASTSGTVIQNDGGYFIQLASVTSEAAAHKAWRKYLDVHSSFTPRGYRVQEANLGERGTYYRIQAGPFSKVDADGICAEMKANKPGSCLVVKK